MKCYQFFHVEIQDRRQLPGTALSRQLRVQFFHHPRCQVVESNVPQIERDAAGLEGLNIQDIDNPSIFTVFATSSTEP